MLLAALSLLVLWCLLAWCAQPDWWRWQAFGIALGLALLTSIQALALLFVVPVAVALWRPAALRRWWSLASAFLVAGLLFSVVFTDPSAGRSGGDRIVLHNPLESTVVWLKPSGIGVTRYPASQAAAADIAPDWTASARSLAAAAWTYLTWPFIALLGGTLVAVGAAALRRRLATERTERSGVASRMARTNALSAWRGGGVCLLWSAGSAVGVLINEPAPTTADLVFIAVPAFPLVGWGLARLIAASQHLPEFVSAAGQASAGPRRLAVAARDGRGCPGRMCGAGSRLGLVAAHRSHARGLARRSRGFGPRPVH